MKIEFSYLIEIKFLIRKYLIFMISILNNFDSKKDCVNNFFNHDSIFDNFT